jgi:hypothetical protein
MAKNILDAVEVESDRSANSLAMAQRMVQTSGREQAAASKHAQEMRMIIGAGQEYRSLQCQS